MDMHLKKKKKSLVGVEKLTLVQHIHLFILELHARNHWSGVRLVEASIQREKAELKPVRMNIQVHSYIISLSYIYRYIYRIYRKYIVHSTFILQIRHLGTCTLIIQKQTVASIVTTSISAETEMSLTHY